MHTIKNLTRQVVLLRFNSGAEVNIAPGAKLDVAPSELRGNKTIEKLHSKRVLDVSDAESPAAPDPSRASSAAAPAADDETNDKREPDEPPRRETPEQSKKRR